MVMNMDDNNFGLRAVNLKRVAESSEFGAITRMTAMQLQKNPYLTVGAFFKGLTSNDISCLNIMVELAYVNHEEQSMRDLIALAEMLAHAEGVDSPDTDSCAEHLNQLATFINVASLAKKGLVTAYFDNFSFGPESGEKKIAELKE